jgi:hypothetical protein
MHSQEPPDDNEQMMARITEIQSRYTEYLMRKPHVTGVAAGMRCRHGITTNQLCLVVMVDEKVNIDELDPDDRIPEEIEGVPVDVQEMGGNFFAQG